MSHCSRILSWLRRRLTARRRPSPRRTILRLECLERREVLATTAVSGLQNGMAPEYMIVLANQLNSDPWLNMPHLASDDYVRTAVTLVPNTVQPKVQAMPVAATITIGTMKAPSA